MKAPSALWFEDERDAYYAERRKAEGAAAVQLEARRAAADALKDLQSAAWRLADKMERLALEIEREGMGAYPNSLGELQGSATEVDRLCGTYDALVRVAGYERSEERVKAMALWTARNEPEKAVAEAADLQIQAQRYELEADACLEAAARTEARAKEAKEAKMPRMAKSHRATAAEYRSAADGKRGDAERCRARLAALVAAVERVEAEKGVAR